MDRYVICYLNSLLDLGGFDLDEILGVLRIFCTLAIYVEGSIRLDFILHLNPFFMFVLCLQYLWNFLHIS